MGKHLGGIVRGNVHILGFQLRRRRPENDTQTAFYLVLEEQVDEGDVVVRVVWLIYLDPALLGGAAAASGAPILSGSPAGEDGLEEGIGRELGTVTLAVMIGKMLVPVKGGHPVGDGRRLSFPIRRLCAGADDVGRHLPVLSHDLEIGIAYVPRIAEEEGEQGCGPGTEVIDGGGRTPVVAKLAPRLPAIPHNLPRIDLAEAGLGELLVSLVKLHVVIVGLPATERVDEMGRRPEVSPIHALEDTIQHARGAGFDAGGCRR